MFQWFLVLFVFDMSPVNAYCLSTIPRGPDELFPSISTTSEILPFPTTVEEELTGLTGMTIILDSSAAVLKRLNSLGLT